MVAIRIYGRLSCRSTRNAVGVRYRRSSVLRVGRSWGYRRSRPSECAREYGCRYWILDKIRFNGVWV